MDEHIKAFAIAMEMREKANDTFLRELITHIALSIPAFDGQLFLDALHLRQESLPSPDRSDPTAPISLERQAIELWRRKIQLTEKALANAETIRSKSY